MFECKYCKSKFTKESTLAVHLCEPKRRYQQKDERFVQLAFRAYQYFYKSTMPQTQRDRTYDDFAKSKYYTAFTKFGRYLYDVHVDDPSNYIDYLLKNMVKIDRWHLDSVYEKYIKEYLKKEPAQKAVERAIIIMKRWGIDNNCEFNDCLEKLSPNRAVHFIRSGKLSPWVLYNCESGVKLLERLNNEQVGLVHDYIEPDYWTAKFQMAQKEVQFVEQVLEKAGM